VADLAVALLDGRGLARPLADHAGVEVAATTAADHLEVAGRLGADGRLVVGLRAVPWPGADDLHAQGSATLPAYTGVVSWHALPALHERLAGAVAPAVAAGSHLLVTAPDPGPETDPADLTFLREVAAGVAARAGATQRSIAWRGEGRSPTTAEALTALVDAHGRLDVVECPVAPGTGIDPRLRAAAERTGARVTCADLGQATLVELLAEVVRTVAAHEEDAR
jgi:hypothetical protein